MNTGLTNSSTEGILLVNKKKGLTSFDVIREIRKKFKTRSVGHTGTLDPFATGLLILLLGRYTRLANLISNQNKTYEAEIYLGKSTDTDDPEGKITQEQNVSYLKEKNILEVIKSFHGIQFQIPPNYSAISIAGERCYEKARRGETIEHTQRTIEIFDINILSIKYINSFIIVNVKLLVSKGTYIRSLARDIGKRLNVPSHLFKLNRTQVGNYNLSEVDEKIKSDVCSIKGIELILINEKIAFELKHGRQAEISLNASNSLEFNSKDDKNNNTVRLAHVLGRPIALIKIQKNLMIPIRIL